MHDKWLVIHLEISSVWVTLSVSTDLINSVLGQVGQNALVLPGLWWFPFVLTLYIYTDENNSLYTQGTLTKRPFSDAFIWISTLFTEKLDLRNCIFTYNIANYIQKYVRNICNSILKPHITHGHSHNSVGCNVISCRMFVKSKVSPDLVSLGCEGFKKICCHFFKMEYGCQIQDGRQNAKFPLFSAITCILDTLRSSNECQ